MQNYVLYSDVDQGINDKMANQAPDVNKRLRAINEELDALQSEYDLFDSIRKKTISVKTDGSTAYDLSVLVSDNDVKTIENFILADTDNIIGGRFTWIDNVEFIEKVSVAAIGNYFTTYTEDGIQYLKVLTVNNSSTAESIDMLYHTTYKALDNTDDFIEAVVNASGVKILLPSRFKELITLGAVKRLFFPAVGEEQAITLNRIEKRYAEQKAILGLTSAKVTKKPVRKISLRKPW